MKWAQTWEPTRTLYVKEPEQVEVFTSDTPDRPYKELGIIEASRAEASRGSLADLVADMRKFAGERGCNALIIVGAEHGSGTVYRGSCVLYISAPSASQAQSPATAPASQRVCVPNATQLCHGPGACKGAQSCLANGSGFTPCDCGSASPSPIEAAPEPASGKGLSP